jgi:hypothetical protein
MPIVSDKYRGKKEYHLVYNELINAARYRGTVTYQEIASLMGLPLTGNYMQSQVGHILGEISEDETENDHPMLSAIAVSVSGSSSSGFFELAKLLGKLKDDSEEGRQKFWEETKQSVYKTWRKELKPPPKAS